MSKVKMTDYELEEMFGRWLLLHGTDDFLNRLRAGVEGAEVALETLCALKEECGDESICLAIAIDNLKIFLGVVDE